MKRLLPVILIATFSIAAHAAEPLNGYIVMANHDTIQCKIKGVRFLLNPFHGITVINEQGESQALPSRDKKIIAFGFVENLRRYDFMFIEVGDKLESGFYQLNVNGPKYKLYHKPTTVYGGNPTYVLFTPSGDFAKFEPCVLCPWKKQLRALLKDDPKALAAVENAPRVNMPQFVIDINKD
jgi:hypothetical protein